MPDLKDAVFIMIIVFFIFFIFGMVLEANAAQNEIPWRFYQLYSGQALVVLCDANEMSIVPQSDLSVLILCGANSKYK